MVMTHHPIFAQNKKEPYNIVMDKEMTKCKGSNGLVCVVGWLYSNINMMIFPANKKCPTCNSEKVIPPMGHVN